MFPFFFRELVKVTSKSVRQQLLICADDMVRTYLNHI
jgi:hypothetical protein